MENPNTSRVALSALCHNLSGSPQLHPHSSPITSLSPKPISNSQSHHSFNQSLSSVNHDLRGHGSESMRSPCLPPINNLSFVTSQCTPSCLASPAVQGTCFAKYHPRRQTHTHVHRLPPCSQLNNFEKTSLPTPKSSSLDIKSPSPAIQYPFQTTLRVCTNCGVRQTRQWVRGENHSWLCHSCGQFWRKNGMPRPRCLWNRPTFKRSSRKPKFSSHAVDGTRKLNGVIRQTATSSFLNGKMMIQCGIRLPPLHQRSSIRGLVGTRKPIKSGAVTSGRHNLTILTEHTSCPNASQCHV